MLVCAALGSAALPFRRETSAAGYGFVASGASSAAIIFVTRCVQSLIGHPNRLQPFRASEAGLEEIAQAYRHMPLVLDEPKNTRGGHRGAVQHIAYLVENGEPAILHSAWQGAPTRIETIVITGFSHDFALQIRMLPKTACQNVQSKKPPSCPFQKPDTI